MVACGTRCGRLREPLITSTLSRGSRQQLVAALGTGVPRSTERIDVAVVGGGPAGLATALALRRVDPSLDVRVYERMAYKKAGASVVLDVNGQKALEAIDPALLVDMERQAIPFQQTLFLDAKTGQPLSSHPMERSRLISRYGKAPLLLGWHEIRHTLVEAVPQEALHWSQPVQCYREFETAVLVEFLEDLSPVLAKVLVGADGWFSYTRFQALGDGPPPFLGRVMWRARVPWRTGLPRENPVWWVEGGEHGGGCKGAIFPISDTEVVWQAMAPVSALSRAHVPLELQAPRAFSMQGDDSFFTDAKERCLAVFEDFHRSFLDVLDLTHPAAVTEHPLHSRGAPVGNRWGRGRVTLVGDAAHAAPPNGQGCNLAFEDARALAESVQRFGLEPEALRAYEAAQSERVRDVLAHVTDTASAEEREGVICAPAFAPLLQRKAIARQSWL